MAYRNRIKIRKIKEIIRLLLKLRSWGLYLRFFWLCGSFELFSPVKRFFNALLTIFLINLTSTQLVALVLINFGVP